MYIKIIFIFINSEGNIYQYAIRFLPLEIAIFAQK